MIRHSLVHRFQEGNVRSFEDRPEGLTGLPEGNCCKRVGIKVEYSLRVSIGVSAGGCSGKITRVEVCVSYP